MIIGLGSDITDIRRIEKVIGRHGERFLERIFTETERARAERKAKRIETYAKRFAAKEACAKALGTGMRAGVWWRDMGVVNLPSGRPTMKLTGGALRRLESMTPEAPMFSPTGLLLSLTPLAAFSARLLVSPSKAEV
jgi:holo-[acyl-carrier protein] synthase